MNDETRVLFKNLGYRLLNITNKTNTPHSSDFSENSKECRGCIKLGKVKKGYAKQYCFYPLALNFKTVIIFTIFYSLLKRTH